MKRGLFVVGSALVISACTLKPTTKTLTDEGQKSGAEGNYLQDVFNKANLGKLYKIGMLKTKITRLRSQLPKDIQGEGSLTPTEQGYFEQLLDAEEALKALGVDFRKEREPAEKAKKAIDETVQEIQEFWLATRFVGQNLLPAPSADSDGEPDTVPETIGAAQQDFEELFGRSPAFLKIFFPKTNEMTNAQINLWFQTVTAEPLELPLAVLEKSTSAMARVEQLVDNVQRAIRESKRPNILSAGYTVKALPGEAGEPLGSPGALTTVSASMPALVVLAMKSIARVQNALNRSNSKEGQSLQERVHAELLALQRSFEKITKRLSVASGDVNDSGWRTTFNKIIAAAPGQLEKVALQSGVEFVSLDLGDISDLSDFQPTVKLDTKTVIVRDSREENWWKLQILRRDPKTGSFGSVAHFEVPEPNHVDWRKLGGDASLELQRRWALAAIQFQNSQFSNGLQELKKLQGDLSQAISQRNASGLKTVLELADRAQEFLVRGNAELERLLAPGNDLSDRLDRLLPQKIRRQLSELAPAIQFDIFRTKYDHETIYVTGNVPELGNWSQEEGEAVALSFEIVPHRGGEIIEIESLGKVNRLEYKYFVKNNHTGEKYWEERGENRFITKDQFEAGETFLAYDTWCWGYPHYCN